jgi:DNA repair photolyase
MAPRKKNQYGIIVLSSVTDPYLQFEEKTRLTRQILELILKYRFPVHIITKSDLVRRDFDILKAINEEAILPADLQDKLSHKVFMTFSFVTLDPSTAKIFEPGAKLPGKRLQVLKESLDHGFFSGVSLMPLLPYISDTGDNLHLIFRTFKEAKVNYIFPATLTLFGNGIADSKTLVLRAVEKHYPHLLEKYTRFFETSTEMPAYYSKAFYAKMKELSITYGLKNSIL